MSKLKITPLRLDGTYLVETLPFQDSRGIFSRFFCNQEMEKLLPGKTIVNVNFSKNYRKGAVRGLHCQKEPFAELKMPRCIRGRILDIFVDVRRNSPTYLQWDSVELSAENMKMVVIPEGFVHGFQSLEDNTEIMYLSTQYFSSENEVALNIRDPKLNIKLPIPITDISERDENHPFIDDVSFKGIII